jgi:hypothetical protein
MVGTPAAESDPAGKEQHMPQQWQELCAQQQQLQVDVLAATLLDSLAYHQSPLPVSSSSSRMKATDLEYVTMQQQQQQAVDQLVLASLVSRIHAQGADKQPTTAAASKLGASRRHGTHPSSSTAQTAVAAPAADPASVLKVLQQLVANGIAIKPFLSSGPEDRRGLGLYRVTAAVVNHDCDPNCSIR